jgi:hypothetical protein
VTKPTSITLRNATAALIAAALMPGMLWAQSDTKQREARYEAGQPVAGARSRPTRAECDKARNDAWFTTQLQMTDGNIHPPVEPAIRADCRDDGSGVKADNRVAKSMTYERLSTEIGGE